MTMTPDEALALARRLVDEVEAQMLATDPGGEPFELVVLQAERADMLELLEQTELRVEAMRARQADAGEPVQSPEQLWAEWNAAIKFLRRSMLPQRLTTAIIRKFGIKNYQRLRP